MNAKYHEDEKFINLNLSDGSNGLLFEMVANELSDVFKVQWKIRADGFDQRYWDFELNRLTLTLHLEHYLGICVFANRTKTDYEQAREILGEIEKHFKACETAI